jgi:hypothetical protein
MIKGKKKVSSLQAALSGKVKFKVKKQMNDNIERKNYGEDEHYALDHRIYLDNSYQIDKSLRHEKKDYLILGDC